MELFNIINRGGYYTISMSIGKAFAYMSRAVMLTLHEPKSASFFLITSGWRTCMLEEFALAGSKLHREEK